MRTTIQVDDETRKKIRILASRRDISYQELIGEMIDVFEELDRDRTIISIPKKLSEKAKEKISKTDFKSVSEFTAFLLRTAIGESKEGFLAKDEKKIKEKLKRLGYMD